MLLISERGDPAAALPYFESALAVFRQAHGPDHPELVSILADYGDTLQRLGRNDEAADMAAEVARIEALTGLVPPMS